MKIRIEKFEAFCKVLETIRNHCEEIIIRNGIIRQRCVNNVVVLEIDLTNIIGDISLQISNIKMKHQLLSTFLYQNIDDVLLDIDDKNCIFSDGQSSIKFSNSIENLMKVSYIEKSYIEKKLDLNDDKLIVSKNIDRSFISKIHSFCRGLEAEKIQIIFINGLATFRITNGDDKSPSWADVFEEPLESKFKNISKHTYFMQYIIPSIVNSAEIEIYHVKQETIVGIVKSTMFPETDKEIPFNTYSLSNVIDYKSSK